MNQRKTLQVNEKGHLQIGGADTLQLAKEFGTPLYVMDEQYIRDMCRVYRDAIEREYDGNGLVLYASKAFSCLAIYKIAAQEQVGVDVVSGGELYTALRAGFPAGRIYMHGNNKQRSELVYAVESGVGTIVVDALSEIDMLDELCGEDSKFGFSIADGTAEQTALYAAGKKNLRLAGYHCHIGSQIFEKQSFTLAVDKMLAFIAAMLEKHGLQTDVLNLGGGYGIWYTDEDAKISCEGYADYLRAVIAELKEKADAYGVKRPYLVIEPGRSIVGEAGITLYTVGAIKEIPGVKKYIAVDGGMFESPRYALYQAKYTPVLANRANEPATETVTIAGKCCESGDIICANVRLPKAESGDLLAVLSTGAYNYSMASNYNRNLIPPVVLVKDGKADYIVKPQSYEDLVRNDVVPERLQ